MTPGYKNSESFPALSFRLPPDLFTSRGLSLTALNLILTAFLFSCSKGEEDVVTPGNTNSGGKSVIIDSTTISSGTAEGNTGIAANEEDLIAKSTFSSVVTIAFGSTVTITNPLSAKGVTITESNGDVIINATVADVEYVLSGTTTNGSVKFIVIKNSNLL